MTIQKGDKLPDATLSHMGENGPEGIETGTFFAGKKIVLFSVPGAFTPTCSAKHLPGFIEKAEEFFAKGIDLIVCTAVNDTFVMNAWGKALGTDGKVMMLADGNGDFVNALGLALDGRGFGMGQRGQRFSMVVEDGVAKELNIEEPGAFHVSSAEYTLAQL